MINNAECFATISDISPEHPVSWEKKLFLTFDIDWACDDVVADCISLVEQADVAATWYITHDTPLLHRLRDNPKFELGIHPNFNFLLMGDSRNGSNAEEVVDRLLRIVPEAKSIRSHSMAQSSVLLDLFKNKGLTHDANHFIPAQAGLNLRPWRLWNGMIKIPYFWEDDLACIYEKKTKIQELKENADLKVFDFHPIHVFLNTENIDRYDSCRHVLSNVNALRGFVNKKEKGVRDSLGELLESWGGY